MRLYQFLLPAFTNDGHSNAAALADWRREALMQAGGYTDHGTVQGVWQDEKGQEYADTMQNITLAIEFDGAYQHMLKRTADLFSDQHSFFVAQIGTAAIVERAKLVA